jgi:cobalamin biosynthesis Mg chelatase CobN
MVGSSCKDDRWYRSIGNAANLSQLDRKLMWSVATPEMKGCDWFVPYGFREERTR